MNATATCEVAGQDHTDGELVTVTLAPFGESDRALRLCPLHLERWKEAREKVLNLENPESIIVLKVEWQDFFRHLNQDHGGGAYSG